MVLPISVKSVDFDTILPKWQTMLWPGRKSTIRPVCPMVFLGGYDMRILNHEKQAVYYAAYDGINTLIGVCSGHPTSHSAYRCRGLWVAPAYQSLAVNENLVRAVYNTAKAHGFELLWSIPRVGNTDFFARMGFVQMSEPFTENVEYGPNVYMGRAIT